jgi:anaerobic selenocysteine-containing dehydrogenase
VAGLAAAFGSGAMTNAIPEIEDASCVVVMGSNTTEAHPLVSHRVFRAKLKGATLIIVDPRKIQLTLQADIHVRLNFGSDVAFMNGMMHAILKNNWQKTRISSPTEQKGSRSFRSIWKSIRPKRPRKYVVFHLRRSSG